MRAGCPSVDYPQLCRRRSRRSEVSCRLMSYAIKLVTPADLPVMRDMLAVFGEAFGEPDTYGGHQPNDAYLEALLGKPHFIALAAVAEGKVVGALAAYVLDKCEQARSEVYID